MNFKKSLVLSTALSAVGVLAATAAIAAEKPQLKISGYQETWFGVADVNDGTTASGTPTYTGAVQDGAFNILQYGEIRFTATGTTDSGMKWGVYFEDVKDDSDGSGTKSSTDEANLWLEGSWGKLEIGGQDGAADKIYVGPGSFDLLSTNILGAFVDTRGDGLRGSADKDNLNDSSDDTKLTYYTPRVSGFQAGVSYIPTLGSEGSVASGSSSGGAEAGADWTGKFSNVGVKVGGNYSYMGKRSNGEDMDGWRVGAEVSFGAISVGAIYATNDNWRTASSEQNVWSLGANYNGGKWEASIIYLDGEEELDSTGAKDEYQEVRLQGAYNLGGGLTASLGLYLFELDARTSTNDNDGTALIGGLNARF